MAADALSVRGSPASSLFFLIPKSLTPSALQIVDIQLDTLASAELGDRDADLGSQFLQWRLEQHELSDGFFHSRIERSKFTRFHSSPEASFKVRIESNRDRHFQSFGP